MLDKAKLGKIDAVIGQKRKLDIEVQDLAAGRFPEELIGRLWNASLIGDDEEYWPWRGRVLGRRIRGVAMKTARSLALLLALVAGARVRAEAARARSTSTRGPRRSSTSASARRRPRRRCCRRSSRSCSPSTEKRRDDKRIEAIGLLRGFLGTKPTGEAQRRGHVQARRAAVGGGAPRCT